MNDPYLATFPQLEPGPSRRWRAHWKAGAVQGAPAMGLARLRSRLRSDRGAATAEYAITTLAVVVLIRHN